MSPGIALLVIGPIVGLPTAAELKASASIAALLRRACPSRPEGERGSRALWTPAAGLDADEVVVESVAVDAGATSAKAVLLAAPAKAVLLATLEGSDSDCCSEGSATRMNRCARSGANARPTRKPACRRSHRLRAHSRRRRCAPRLRFRSPPPAADDEADCRFRCSPSCAAASSSRSS